METLVTSMEDLDCTADKIQEVSRLCRQCAAAGDLPAVVQLWLTRLQRAEPGSRLAFMYLANDLVQQRQHADGFIAEMSKVEIQSSSHPRPRPPPTGASSCFLVVPLLYPCCCR